MIDTALITKFRQFYFPGPTIITECEGWQVVTLTSRLLINLYILSEKVRSFYTFLVSTSQGEVR